MNRENLIIKVLDRIVYPNNGHWLSIRVAALKRLEQGQSADAIARDLADEFLENACTILPVVTDCEGVSPDERRMLLALESGGSDPEVIETFIDYIRASLADLTRGGDDSDSAGDNSH